MAGKDHGYTPEEIQAFRVKLAGQGPAPLGAGLTEFDKKASDVSASLSRAAEHPAMRVARNLASGGSGVPLEDAATQFDLARKGGIGDLSKATQSALAKPTAPEELKPIYSPDAPVEAAPSLKDHLLSKLRGNVGGGGGPNPLGGLRSSYLSARRKQIGDFDTDKDLAREMGENRSQHVMTLAEWQHHDANQKQRDAQIDMEAADRAHQNVQAALTRNMQLADEIGKQKIDPKRLVKSMGAGEKVAHVLGSALGGFVSGFRGGPNETLERFDRRVSEDIQAQINEVDNKKAQLGARQNLVAQMIQETGDRRLGVLAARNLMYEAGKQHLVATDAQLGVPEISTNAKQTAQAFQHQQDAMNSQFSAELLQQEQARQAAAAAAQKAAEREAWQRQMQVAELGMKQDELRIKAAQAAGGSIEDLNKQAQHLGEKLADPALAQGRAAVDAAKMRLDKGGKDSGLPGVGKWADIRSAVLGDRIGLSDEERVSRGDWEKIKLSYRKQITGSGGSAEEMKAIERAFEGAKTPAEQRNAIAEADAFFKQIEARQKAGVDPRALQLYENRMTGQAGIQPRQSNVSDERAKQFKKKVTGY